jgi:hypothetical protein
VVGVVAVVVLVVVLGVIVVVVFVVVAFVVAVVVVGEVVAAPATPKTAWALTGAVVWHVAPWPLQVPAHFEKTDPEPGLANRVTGVPTPTVVEHVCPHAIPAGELVTVPLPDVVTVTDAGGAPSPM